MFQKCIYINRHADKQKPVTIYYRHPILISISNTVHFSRKEYYL